MPFVFPGGIDMPQLVERFDSYGRRGAIVGPHGSGKSTLLATLADALGERGYTAIAVTPSSLATTAAGRPNGSRDVLLVDGWDQLFLWQRWLIRLQSRCRGWGLVATSHRPMDLPVLLSTSTSLGLAQRIAGELAGPEFTSRADACIREAFARHDGNLREVLFDLYDRYERTFRSPEGMKPR